MDYQKKVLLIQPPAGTFDALINNGPFLPSNLDNIFHGQVDKIINQIKLNRYQLVITGIAFGGRLENGLKLIEKLLQNNLAFKNIQIIIYTYQNLLGDLQSFISHKWATLPDNWKVVAKQTTYYFEHEDLIKSLKNK